MGVQFRVYRDRAGEYRWRLVASNGEKVAASEGYVTKSGALTSARRVKELASSAVVVDTTVFA